MKRKKDDSGDQFVTPAQQAAFFSARLAQEAEKVRLYRERTAKRDALLERMGLASATSEEIVDRVRRSFPDQQPERLRAMHANDLAFWLERTIEAESAAQSATRPAGKVPAKKATVEGRMKVTLAEKPGAASWSLSQWADYLDCGRSTVHGTKLWKSLRAAHCLQQVERLEQQEKTRGLKVAGLDNRKKGRNID